MLDQVCGSRRAPGNHSGNGAESSGKIIARSILPTEDAALLEFFAGMRGAVHVAFEEGTQAQWLHDLLTPRVARVVVGVGGYAKGLGHEVLGKHPAQDVAREIGARPLPKAEYVEAGRRAAAGERLLARSALDFESRQVLTHKNSVPI
jgi:hypothetical protein